MVGSGLVNYTIPLMGARAEIGQEASPSAIGSYSHYLTTAHPGTQNVIEGWKWDQRVWADHNTENVAAVLPTNWDPTYAEITTSYFQSGIGDNNDLHVDSIESIPSSGLNETNIYNLWSPNIRHGYYYDYYQEGYLFSDDSEVKYLTYSGVSLIAGHDPPSGFNLIALGCRPKIGIPIIAQRYTWDDIDGEYDLIVDVKKRLQFTGIKDVNNVRASTYNSDSELILWDNIDDGFMEFILTFTESNEAELIFNRQYVLEEGTIENAPSGLEFLGYSNGQANEQFHLLYSPIDETMDIDIYSYLVASGLITQWTAIDCDEIPTGYQAKVDYDLGIIEFGDPDIAGQLVPVAGASIGAHYWKTLRVEFEPENTIDTILATESNVNPVYRKNANGFIRLSNQLEDPMSLIIEADLPLIEENVYGPFYIGSAYTSIIATVKDARERVLEDQVVSFFITLIPAMGTFGFINTSIESITDEFGQAYAYYNPPRSISEIGENVEADNYSTEAWPAEPVYAGMSEITRLHTETLFIDGTNDDVFLYGVHIDDPTQGYLDVALDIENLSVQTNEFYRKFFVGSEIYGPTGLDPLTMEPNTNAIAWEDMHRMAWNLARPLIFQSNHGMGRKQLISKVDATMLNPYSYTYGAVGPVQPVNIEDIGAGEFNIVYDTSSLVMPKPTVTDVIPNGTLHSYLVIAPTEVTIQASVFNERLNQQILSNEISIKLRIPTYMSGMWIIDAINQNHIDEVSALLASIIANGQKVPLGWRLRSSRITLAGALDGVTFLDTNRPWNYDPYDPDNVLYSGIRLGHQFRMYPQV